MLSPGAGELVELSNLGTFEVGTLIGEGGQGAVFEMHPTSMQQADKTLALKWYFPKSATKEQYGLLSDLVDRGPPDRRFLWPIDIATCRSEPCFGYAMPLRPPGFHRMSDLLNGRVKVSFRELTAIGLALADSFLNLHVQGLCYRDISDGNLFLRQDDGAVLICDNDNVGIDGESPGNVRGTPYYMAPEVMRDEVAPSTTSDQFSLAVMLFYLFMLDHPLEGRAAPPGPFDLDAQMQLFAHRPVFIFDPDDDSNRPLSRNSNASKFWPVYPQFLRDRFTQAFTDGIRDPLNGRVQESTWRADMARLRDSLIYCPSCEKQNFFDDSGREVACWSCQRSIVTPMRLRIDRNRLHTSVMLNHDSQLFCHHLRGNYDFTTPVAEVVKHPTDPSRWGLRNLSDDTWSAVDKTGHVYDLPPGRTIALLPHLKITFPQATAEILPR